MTDKEKDQLIVHLQTTILKLEECLDNLFELLGEVGKK